MVVFSLSWFAFWGSKWHSLSTPIASDFFSHLGRNWNFDQGGASGFGGEINVKHTTSWVCPRSNKDKQRMVFRMIQWIQYSLLPMGKVWSAWTSWAFVLEKHLLALFQMFFIFAGKHVRIMKMCYSSYLEPNLAFHHRWLIMTAPKNHSFQMMLTFVVKQKNLHPETPDLAGAICQKWLDIKHLKVSCCKEGMFSI